MELVIDGVKYLGVSKVAELTGKDPATIRRILLRGGATGAFRAGSLWLVPESLIGEGIFARQHGWNQHDRVREEKVSYDS